MKKINVAVIGIALVFAASGCEKEKSESSAASAVSPSEVLNDFAHALAIPNYEDIESKAGQLFSAVQQLDAATNETNLAAARTAWRQTRTAWEQSEGFLFGPVEDFNYDPAMDDWPVNKVDMDSLLSSGNALTLADIDLLETSLKGFHPIEYMLFGSGGVKTAAEITSREKTYLISLTQNLYNTTIALRNSWDVNQSGNFAIQLTTAGNGSTRFQTRKDAFISIVTAMAGICDEVANGKMQDPLAAQDSTLEESQFAHSSTSDFRNNMIGIQNVYLGKYTNDGKGMNELVAAVNRSLDNKLKSQIQAAINSFDAINSNYGAAIYNQQSQIMQSQEAINTLRMTIEDELMNFIHVHIAE